MFRKMVCILLLALQLTGLAVPAAAQEQEEAQQYIQNMISYYFHYREQALPEISDQIGRLSAVDPGQAAVWQEIMDTWDWANREMTVPVDVLSDGLPEDDSLCIVVLGYGLNDDGSMKPELIRRLEVALASGEKYPEAYILCTGGETSDAPGVTEAGQMARWLLDHGVREGRLILEERALSTTDNARNCYRMLWADYPQISSIAIVTSDYHIRWGTAVFTTAILHGVGYEGGRELTLVGTAACATDTPDRDTMHSQAWGVSILGGVPFDSSFVPQLYMPRETVTPETEPPAQILPQPTAEQAPVRKEPVLPVLLGLVLVLAVILIPKRRKK